MVGDGDVASSGSGGTGCDVRAEEVVMAILLVASVVVSVVL